MLMLSCVQLFSTPQTVAHQAPLSMGFPRQEYWSELTFSSPGDLPNPGIEPGSPALQADSLPLYHLGSRIIGTEFLLYDKNGIKPDCGDGCKIL